MTTTVRTICHQIKSVTLEVPSLWTYWMLIFFLSTALSAQENNLSNQVTNAFVLQSSPKIENKTRRMMFHEGKEKVVNPLKVVFGGLMFLYQNVLSEQISAHCMYEISCSEYTKLNIEQNGFFRGVILGFHQLMHCTPSTTHEVPPYMFTPYSTKIANDVHQIR